MDTSFCLGNQPYCTPILRLLQGFFPRILQLRSKTANSFQRASSGRIVTRKISPKAAAASTLPQTCRERTGESRTVRHCSIRPPSKGKNGSRLKHPCIRPQIASRGNIRNRKRSRKLPKGPASAQKNSRPFPGMFASMTASPTPKCSLRTCPPRSRMAAQWQNS